MDLNKLRHDILNLVDGDPLSFVDVSSLIKEYIADPDIEKEATARVRLLNLLRDMRKANEIFFSDGDFSGLTSRVNNIFQQNDGFIIKSTLARQREIEKGPTSPNINIGGNFTGNLNTGKGHFENTSSSPVKTKDKKENTFGKFFHYISNNQLLAGILVALLSGTLLIPKACEKISQLGALKDSTASKQQGTIIHDTTVQIARDTTPKNPHPILPQQDQRKLIEKLKQTTNNQQGPEQLTEAATTQRMFLPPVVTPVESESIDTSVLPHVRVALIRSDDVFKYYKSDNPNVRDDDGYLPATTRSIEVISSFKYSDMRAKFFLRRNSRGEPIYRYIDTKYLDINN